MELLYEIFTVLAVFLGLFGGFLLSWIAPEELVPGKRYFLLLQRALLALIFGVFIFSLNFGLLYKVILAVLLSGAVAYFNIDDRIIYPVAGVLVVLTIPDKAYLMILASLVFMYGMIVGTLFCTKYVKGEKFNEKLSVVFVGLISRHWYFLLAAFFVFGVTLLV